MARKYTEKVHAKRLLQMLKHDDVCNLCVAAQNFKESVFIKGITEERACPVCRGFIGLKNTNWDKPCPCDALGKKRAIQRTWEALEEKGYI